MRQYVANIIIFPTQIADVAAYTRGSVLAFSPAFFKIGVLVHEFTHILDMVALAHVVSSAGYPEGTPFSTTPMWTWSVDNDTAVTTPYAQTNMPENFADAGRWAMSSLTHYGGLGEYSDGWEGCRTQIHCYVGWLGSTIFPRGKYCTGKVESSEAVPAAQRGLEGAATNFWAEKPKGTLEGTQVKGIRVPKGIEHMVFVYHGPAPV